MLPFSLGAGFFSIASGMVVARTRVYRPVMYFAWTVMTLGYGLMVMLDNTSNT